MTDEAAKLAREIVQYVNRWTPSDGSAINYVCAESLPAFLHTVLAVKDAEIERLRNDVKGLFTNLRESENVIQQEMYSEGAKLSLEWQGKMGGFTPELQYRNGKVVKPSQAALTLEDAWNNLASALQPQGESNAG